MVIRPIPHVIQDPRTAPTQDGAVPGRLGGRSAEALAPGPARARASDFHGSGTSAVWERHGAIEAAPNPRAQRQG